MCDYMQSGGLVSTFGIWNTSYYAPAATVFCPPQTPYAYCWGAYCEPDPTKPGMATCQCPKNINPMSDAPTRVFIQQPLCSSSCKDDICNDKKQVHNGGGSGQDLMPFPQRTCEHYTGTPLN